MLGIMIDCSRNAVMTISALKHYVDTVSKMGYDTLMLYTEDTLEIDNEPYLGYMRGRYTKQEIRELDAYCSERGIELIPCIQTLAHLDTAFQISNKYTDICDCDDILLAADDRTYRFIENMISTIATTFTSRKIHIGMDEAGKVGLGKYLAEHGFCDRFDIINTHLHKVCEIADKYGFEPMIWSDMFCRLAAGSEDYYDIDFTKIREKAALPEKISLAYWDYYSDDCKHYEKMFRIHKEFGREVIFAGGAWTWKGFSPDNAFAINVSDKALRVCREQGVDNVIITMWGDDGAECSRLSALPALCYISEAYRGNFDTESIKKKFEELTDMSFDGFMLLDEPNRLGGKHSYNPAKYLLYNDLFTGLNDYRTEESDGDFYKDAASKLRAVAPKKEYEDIFDTQIALCDLLSVKAGLGVKTRNAYKRGDKALIYKLATEDYALAIERTESFYEAFAKQWNAENKPFGFDIQDLRLGGLIQRLKACRGRLLDYVEGRAESIPELEVELLEDTGKVNWNSYATPNVITHALFR